jgi:hypothetical protein
MVRTSESPVAYEGGHLIAAGDLEDALYGPVGNPSRGSFTVADATNACRRFMNGNLSGIACKQEGHWRIREMRQDIR